MKKVPLRGYRSGMDVDMGGQVHGAFRSAKSRGRICAVLP